MFELSQEWQEYIAQMVNYAGNFEKQIFLKLIIFYPNF